MRSKSSRGSVQLHRHEFDAISIMMSNRKSLSAHGHRTYARTLRGSNALQSRGYVHSTSIEGDATYRNVTVELLSLSKGAAQSLRCCDCTQG